MRFAGSFAVSLMLMLGSCAGSRYTADPNGKFPAEILRKDYDLFRNILEESHPSLYWFTPRDSMDYFFAQARKQISDSMSERDFRTLLTYVTTKIRCGHTSLRYSKIYSKFLDTAQLNLFPIRLKFLDDVAVITGTLIPKDSVLKRGMLLKAINDVPVNNLRDTFLHYLSGDGYSRTGRLQSLSNAGNFGVLYKNLFGLPDSFNIRYQDSSGFEMERTIPVFNPVKDSIRFAGGSRRKFSRRERRNLDLFGTRNMQVDTSLNSAYITVNTFARGYGLRGFFRRSFKSVEKLNIDHIVIDVRGNGGGDAGNSTLLTQYVADHRFRIADSLYAIKRSSRYSRHIRLQPLYWLMMSIVTRKQSDGNYHFGFFERHSFKPKKKHHFKGQVYILTGGNSFSATTLFAQSVKGQKNVTIIGEETGGGAYGNTAWMIPEVRLPNTGIRLLLPKFRLVMRSELVAAGRGVLPDIEVSPTPADIRRGLDAKVEVTRKMIEGSKKIP